MKISLKELKAAISYLEKNSDMDTVSVTANNECVLTTMDFAGSEIQITLFPISNSGDPSMLAKVRRTDLLPTK